MYDTSVYYKLWWGEGGGGKIHQPKMEGNGELLSEMNVDSQGGGVCGDGQRASNENIP